jgi:hypothetical protein
MRHSFLVADRLALGRGADTQQPRPASSGASKRGKAVRVTTSAWCSKAARGVATL